MMSQQVKALATKPGGLRLILGTHVVEGELVCAGCPLTSILTAVLFIIVNKLQWNKI